jgi:chromate reductase
MTRLVGIAGSLRRESVHRAVLRAVDAAWCRAEDARFSTWAAMADVPPFDPDHEEPAPAAIADLRATIDAADGVVLACPEYAHSLPGVLKNTLDWLVGSSTLYGKPVALLSASPGGGGRALTALSQTLHAQGAWVVDQCSLAAARHHVRPDGSLVDGEPGAAVADRLEELLERLRVAIDARARGEVASSGDVDPARPRLASFPSWIGAGGPPATLHTTGTGAGDGSGHGAPVDGAWTEDMAWTDQPVDGYLAVIDGVIELFTEAATVVMGSGDEFVLPQGLRWAARVRPGTRWLSVQRPAGTAAR